MTKSDILSQLTEIMREYFDDETIDLNENTTADDVEEWDSMSHVNIMIAIEEHFGIKVPVTEVDQLKNVGDLVDMIARKAA